MTLTKIDWLGFRTQAEVPAVLNGLRDAFGEFGPMLKAQPRKKGWMGFQQAADLSLGGMHIGLIAYGGENQRGWVSTNITGRGCEWVPDWEQADDALSRFAAYEHRRVDIALDTFNGEVSHEKVLAAYRSGQFAIHGKPPSMSQILPEDPTDGRTIYIGKRDQGKFLRAYEKGHELCKDTQEDITHIDGVPVEDIYRLEVEFKAKNALLPQDLIDKRDQYFAGAYPYLQEVLKVEPEIFSQARERGPQNDLNAVCENIRRQYGSSIYTLLAALKGDVGGVMDRIIGDRHNEALVAQGVLLVDHE